jgi:hypothetical protein
MTKGSRSVLCLFYSLTFCRGSKIAQVWEHLTKLAETYPVEGNKGGSYLTMFSKGGFVFGIINIIGAQAYSGMLAAAYALSTAQGCAGVQTRLRGAACTAVQRLLYRLGARAVRVIRTPGMSG